ncbi:MAG: type II secretion system F family protein [Candidatus Riflebacteria bacterium]|nr:type II secretion system F family protein [Candidatus Riflebacteria bacterium]
MDANSLFFLFKIIALLAITIGIYLVVEEQIEIIGGRKRREQDPTGLGGKKFLRSHTNKSLDDELIEALLMINSSLKAGRNLDQAFELVAISTPPPICNEFRILVQERRLGVPMIEALTNLSKRVRSQDLQLAINATIFQQETGGNLEDLYKQIVATVAERKKIFGKIIAGTAHARISGFVVGVIPIVMAFVMFIWHPGYIQPMLQNRMGFMVLILAIASAGLGIFFINRMTTTILPETEDKMAKLNLAALKRKEWQWIIIKPLLQLLVKFNQNMKLKFFQKYRDDLSYIMALAGNPGGFTPDEFIALKEISAIFFVCVVIIFFNPFKYGLFGWLLLLVLIPVGFHLPRVYLTQRIRARQRNIEFELPYTIDLLSLAIEAGLDLVGGIQKICDKSRPTDIVIEFQTLLNDIKLGKTLEEGLSDMADRVQILAFFSFVSSLVQAQRLGAEIGPTLRAQAEQMRYQRMILAEEKVNQLPVKLLIPLVFFIFPSIFVLIMGPSLTHVIMSLPHQ